MTSLEKHHKRADYRKLEHGECKAVIVEIDPNGVETFHCRELGEVRWFEFVPSEQERTFARSILNRDKERSGGNYVLDLDTRFADHSAA